MSDPIFHVVYTFVSGIDEFVNKGIYTKVEDAEERANALRAELRHEKRPDPKVYLVQQSQEMVASHLIQMHIKAIAGDSKRVVISWSTFEGPADPLKIEGRE